MLYKGEASVFTPEQLARISETRRAVFNAYAEREIKAGRVPEGKKVKIFQTPFIFETPEGWRALEAKLPGIIEPDARWLSWLEPDVIEDLTYNWFWGREGAAEDLTCNIVKGSKLLDGSPAVEAGDALV